MTTQNTDRPLTLKQQMIVDEFVKAYDLDATDIGFEGKSDKPFFYYDALATVAYKLLDFDSLEVAPTRVEPEQGYAMSEAILVKDGRTLKNYATCFIGQTFGDDRTVNDITTALHTSRSLALRAVLRMVGFDPVRAHRAHLADEQIELEQISDPRTKDLRFIHATAAELGWINGEDDSEYRRQIGIYFDGLKSAGDMTERQRAQFIAILTGLIKARNYVAPADAPATDRRRAA